jgi:hypothetical protein
VHHVGCTIWYDYYYGRYTGFKGISVNTCILLCTEKFRDWGKFCVLQKDDAFDNVM